MYIVTINNGGNSVEIHNEHHKLLTGSVVKGINSIDSFTFSVLPGNPAFGELHEFTTLVSVYNTAKSLYEFHGRVLYTVPGMDSDGLITQEATCESYLGFLCDSRQKYVEEKNWTVRELLEHILSTHNFQMEEYKLFLIGQVDVEDPNDNLYVGIQRENTWEALQKKLVEKLGGEIRLRVADGRNYIDYLKKIGETKTTEIALSRNMKSITKEKDPSSFVTRLIPLGAKLNDYSEERLDIMSVNNGKNYIDDAEAIAEYGLHVGYVEFDDVTDATNLLNKGRAWLKDNNKVAVKYVITALDLSRIGLDADDFEIYNEYPVKNRLLGIEDVVRINKQTINICDEDASSFEVGESFKTLSELQREQYEMLRTTNKSVAEIIRNYVTNQALVSESERIINLIEQTDEQIRLSVSQTYATQTQLSDYATKDELRETVANIEITDDQIVNAVSGKFVTVDSLKNYYTSAQVDSKITTSLEGINLSAYAKTEDVNGQIEEVEGTLSLALLKNAKGELASQVTIKSGYLEIDTTNFKLGTTGSVTCSDITITGGAVKIARDEGGYNALDKYGVESRDSNNSGLRLNGSTINAYNTEGIWSEVLRATYSADYELTLRLGAHKLNVWEKNLGKDANGLTGIVDKSDYMLFFNGILVDVQTDYTKYQGTETNNMWLHDNLKSPPV